MLKSDLAWYMEIFHCGEQYAAVSREFETAHGIKGAEVHAPSMRCADFTSTRKEVMPPEQLYVLDWWKESAPGYHSSFVSAVL